MYKLFILHFFLLYTCHAASALKMPLRIIPDIAGTKVKGGETSDEGNSEDISIKKHFFQDIFSEQLTPEKLQFGHVYENPNDWEQRFEEKDLAQNRNRGKVKWGDRHGVYGEQYWDINH